MSAALSIHHSLCLCTYSAVDAFNDWSSAWACCNAASASDLAANALAADSVAAANSCTRKSQKRHVATHYHRDQRTDSAALHLEAMPSISSRSKS